MKFRYHPIAAALAATFVLPAVAETTDLAPVLVTATRTATRVDSVLSDVTVISGEELRNSGQTTLPEVLGMTPGLQFVSNGGRGASGSLFIRGTNAAHAVVLVDGQRISSATLGTTALEHIPLEQLDRIEIVRGPASSLYGADAIGGVVQIFTHRGEGRPAPSFALGYGRYDTVTGSLGYGGRVGDTAFDIRAGWENSGGFSTLRNGTSAFSNAYNADRDPYENNNLNASLSHRISDAFEVGAQALRIRGRKSFDSANCDAAFTTCTPNYDNRLTQDLDSYSAYLKVKPTSGWTSQLRLGQSEDASVNRRLDPSVPVVVRDRYKTTQDQASWENDISLGQAGKVLAAYEWREERVSSTQPFTVNSRNYSAVVLGYQGWYGPHSVQASVRRDDISRFDPQTSSSLAYGYQILPSLRARAAVGRAYHVPTFNELYWPVDYANFFRGNPDLKTEKAFNREVGLNYERGATQAGLTLYYNRVTDLLNYVAGGPPTWMGQYENIGKATLKGATLTFAQRLGNWNFRSGFDYLDAKDDVTGLALQRRVPRSANVELSHNQGPLQTGVQVLGYAGAYNDTANSEKLGGYALTNVFANYKLDGGWSVLGRVNNLFDRKYVVIRDFNGSDYSVPGASLFVGVRYQPK